MKKLTFAIIALLGMGISGTFAQGAAATDNQTINVIVPEVAKLAIANGMNAAKNFDAAFTSPAMAGQAILAPTAPAAYYLQYSSIKKAGSTAAGAGVRNISVVADVLVAGVNIDVTAVVPTTAPAIGQVGMGSVKTLATTSSDLITTVGSGYTGTGTTDGAAITYAITAPDGTYSSLVATAGTAVKVTYTLSEN